MDALYHSSVIMGYVELLRWPKILFRVGCILFQEISPLAVFCQPPTAAGVYSCINL